jgi:Tol biopolymer transport system component
MNPKLEPVTKEGLSRIQAVARYCSIQNAVISLAVWGAINIGTWYFFGADDRKFLSGLTTNPAGSMYFLIYGGLILGAVMFAFAALGFTTRRSITIVLNGLSLIAIGIWNIIHNFIAMEALRPYGYTVETGPVSFWSVFGIAQVIWGFQQFSSFWRIINWSPARLTGSELQKLKVQLHNFVSIKESAEDGIVKASITHNVLGIGLFSRTTQYTGRLLDNTALMISDKLDDCFTIERKAMSHAAFSESSGDIVPVSVRVNKASVVMNVNVASVVAFKSWCAELVTIAAYHRLVPPREKHDSPSQKPVSVPQLKQFPEAEDSQVRAVASATLETVTNPLAPAIQKEISKDLEVSRQEPQPYQVEEDEILSKAKSVESQQGEPEPSVMTTLPGKSPEVKQVLQSPPPREVVDRNTPARGQTQHCPHCHQEHPEGTLFCPLTGKKINLSEFCPQCGKPVEPGWLHCGYCGRKLNQEEGVSNQQEVQPTGYPQAPIIKPESSKPRKRSSKAYIPVIAGGIGLLLIASAVMFNAFGSDPNAKQAATTTPATWTVTPMPTATTKPSPVPTATPTSTPAITLPPLPEGWRGYIVSGFYIALPEQWVTVNIDKEGIESILNLIKDLNAEWAQNITAMVSAEDYQETAKFWAVDADPAGVNYASANIIFQSLPFSGSSDDVCVEVPTAYEQMGIELLDIECGLEIGLLDIAHLTARLRSDSLAAIQDQYFYVQGQNSWILTLSVDEVQWAEYQPIFNTIADSFRVSDNLSTGSIVASTPYVEPAGKIAFESERDGNIEIYVMDADGSSQTRLTNNPTDDNDPAWSADGQKIAFDSNRDGNYKIYVMNADGSALTRLTDNLTDDGFPTWSADGQKIAFMSARDGNDEIYVMNADGSAQTRLTTNQLKDGVPTWSKDGQKIAFVSLRDGNAEIYAMNADGSAQTRLTNNPAVDSYPTWSADGQKIAFYSNRDGNGEIYVMNADGGNPTRITNNEAEDGYPTWLPDGQKIAFTSVRGGNWEIYVMDADGNNQTPLTFNTANDGYPDWSPSAPQATISLIPTQEAIPSSTSLVRIVSNNSPASSRLELWLEFAFAPGDTLPGSQIESELNNGILELTLPGGEKKTFEQVPHSLTDSEITSDLLLPQGIGTQGSPPPAGALPLNGFLFENYSNSPNGPQIRIPLEKISDISVIGEYQIAWKSGNLISNTVTFEWDGTGITVHVP